MTDVNTRTIDAESISNLSSLKVSQLQELAHSLGIVVSGKLRKQELVSAISNAQPAADAVAPAETEAEAPVAATPTEAALPTESTLATEATQSTESAETSEVEAATTVEVTPSGDDVVSPEESAPAERTTSRKRGSRRAKSTDSGQAIEVSSAPVSAGAHANAEQSEHSSLVPEASEERENGGRRRRNDSAEKREQNKDAEAGDAASAAEQRDGDEPREQREPRGRRGRGRDRNRNNADSANGNNNGANNNNSSNEKKNNDRQNDRQNQSESNERSGNGRNTELTEDEVNNLPRGARNRYRDRKRRGGAGSEDFELEISEDDVLIPVAGILDILENYAFIRTTGYLPGASDVYVSLGQVKKYNLRKGDAVVGAIRQPREGEGNGRQKYNAIIKIESVNGNTVDEAATRVDFADLTPLYPQERLRLETDAANVTQRIFDVAAPIGKGQRGLILSPPKSGKTEAIQQISHAISTNNPEAHLMVVLIDERPEEVTEMQRSIRGEVIASTCDRPAEDHTLIADLAIERAKRLVELGHDVVVLLDSLTKLGRAHNQSVPASARAASFDASTLHAPKRFFAAARNIENGGSLTIIATALVETGSSIDEAIVEEFASTANSELRLSRTLAEKRIFPAVDVRASGTRREELFVSADELAATWKLRRALAESTPQASLELVLGKLKGTSSNAEFLANLSKVGSKQASTSAAH